MNDLRFALRSLAKSPGFTVAVVFTLALGMGAATAIFSLVHGLLWRPLPFADQDDVVMIREATRQNSSSSVAYPNFVDWRDRQRSFTELGAVRLHDANVTQPGGPERIGGAMVSHGFFPALGVQPVQGRLFAATEDQPGAARTVLIRESLARRRFADAAGAPGRSWVSMARLTRSSAWSPMSSCFRRTPPKSGCRSGCGPTTIATGANIPG